MPPKKPRQSRLQFTSKATSSSSTTSATSRTPTSRGRGGSTPAKKFKRGPPNASILSFFQKVPRRSKDIEDRLFMEGEFEDVEYGGDVGYDVVDEEEVVGAARGKETDDEEIDKLFLEESPVPESIPPRTTPVQQQKKAVKGPFIVEEDEDSEVEELPQTIRNAECSPVPPISKMTSIVAPPAPPASSSINNNIPQKRKVPFTIDQEDEQEEVGARGQPKKDKGGPLKLDYEEDFKDEEMLEMGEDDDDEDSSGGDNYGFELGADKREERRFLEMLQEQENLAADRGHTNEESLSCPICGAALAGLKEDEATRHANACLDGGEGSEIGGVVAIQSSSETVIQSTPLKPIRQISPFLTPSPSNKPTAFSHILAKHTEHAAWAAASLAEAASRGKPAAQRTCPFYKLLFSGMISMDAFKYGEIPSVNAYFLSHFHSDHYGGLTAGWKHGLIWCTRVTANLVRTKLGVDPRWVREMEFDTETFVDGGEGLWVTAIPANHCPGSAIFIFERKGPGGRCLEKVLHCGDFRAAPWMLKHPKLKPTVEYFDEKDGKRKTKMQWIDAIYLDTTYLSPKYAFPSQKEVIDACAKLCVGIDNGDDKYTMGGKAREGKGVTGMMGGLGKMAERLIKSDEAEKKQEKLLVVVGTYSIGKERICVGIARALNSKIYAPPNKQKICACLEDPELNDRLTSNPQEAQVHMTPLMEIRAETLADYLNDHKPHFTRVVGFRPSGWNYKPPSSRSTDSPAVSTILHSPTWNSHYTPNHLVPGRGSNREAACFGVPYSEHSSFRELTMFICGLNVKRVVPTVNVGSAKSRERMGVWIEKWAAEKRKNGLFEWKEEGYGSGNSGSVGGKGDWGNL